MNIIRKGETIEINGVTYSRPTLRDKSEADAITRRQEILFSEMMNIPVPLTEEGHGRKRMLERKTAKLELRKHPLLRVWFKHLELWK